MYIEQLEQLINQMAAKVDGYVSLMIEVGSKMISINHDKRCSAASLIKVPILMEAYRQAESGILDLSEKITIPPSEKVGGAGVLKALSPEAALTIKDLMTLMIIVSDNTATNVLIDRLGIDSINQLCTALHCSCTHLGRRLMDFDAIEKGMDNFTSAGDMIRLLKEIDQGPRLGKESRKEMISIMNAQQFYDKLPARMDRDLMFVANKTGELPGIEHDAAIIRTNNLTAYAAVLTYGLFDNYEGRQIISDIGKVLFEYLVSLSE